MALVVHPRLGLDGEPDPVRRDCHRVDVPTALPAKRVSEPPSVLLEWGRARAVPRPPSERRPFCAQRETARNGCGNRSLLPGPAAARRAERNRCSTAASRERRGSRPRAPTGPRGIAGGTADGGRSSYGSQLVAQQPPHGGDGTPSRTGTPPPLADHLLRRTAARDRQGIRVRAAGITHLAMLPPTLDGVAPRACLPTTASIEKLRAAIGASGRRRHTLLDVKASTSYRPWIGS